MDEYDVKIEVFQIIRSERCLYTTNFDCLESKWNKQNKVNLENIK